MPLRNTTKRRFSRYALEKAARTERRPERLMANRMDEQCQQIEQKVNLAIARIAMHSVEQGYTAITSCEADDRSVAITFTRRDDAPALNGDELVAMLDGALRDALFGKPRHGELRDSIPRR